MAAPYPVPGKDYLISLKASLQAQYDTNAAQITALTSENTALDAQLDLLTEAIDYTTSLTQLAAPTNVVVTSPATGQAQIAWDDNASADSFIIQQANTADFTGATEVFNAPYSSPQTISSLTSGQMYYFRVKAIASDMDDSEWSSGSVTIS